MDSTVNHEASPIHVVSRLTDLMPLLVYQHQGRRGDFFEKEPVGVDQKMMLRARYAGTDVGEHQIRPTIQSNQPITRRQITSQLPLLLTHLRLERRHLHLNLMPFRFLSCCSYKSSTASIRRGKGLTCCSKGQLRVISGQH